MNLFSRIPSSAELIDGELFDIGTGEPVVIPASCECDEGGLCYAIACQERSFAERDHYAALYAGSPRISADEWNDVHSDNRAKRESYDRLVGPS